MTVGCGRASHLLRFAVCPWTMGQKSGAVSFQQDAIGIRLISARIFRDGETPRPR
jgi:hypothetical protein